MLRRGGAVGTRKRPTIVGVANHINFLVLRIEQNSDLQFDQSSERSIFATTEVSSVAVEARIGVGGSPSETRSRSRATFLRFRGRTVGFLIRYLRASDKALRNVASPISAALNASRTFSSRISRVPKAGASCSTILASYNALTLLGTTAISCARPTSIFAVVRRASLRTEPF